MISSSFSVETPWSAEQAFAYMSDMTNFSAWDPGTKAARLLDGEAGTADAVYELKAGVLTLRYQVTEHTAPDDFGAEAEHTLLRSSDSISVSATPTGSLITYDATLHTRGVGRLLEPALHAAFPRMSDKAAEGLAKATNGRRIR